MKKYFIFIFILFQCHFLTVRSQNAPVTTAGSALSASPGTVTVPITVEDFIDIGSVSLRLTYDESVLTFVSGAGHPALTGMVISNPDPGIILIGWFTGGSSLTFPDDIQIAELNFTFISGSTELLWDNTSSNGAACQYMNGSFIVLNDDPTETYYKYGVVTDHSAPITIAPTITTAIPGPVSIPVIVKNFFDIGTISLALEYDPAVLSYTSFTANTIFNGELFVNDVNGDNGKRRLIISYVGGTACTLPDSSVLVSFQFNYSTGFGTGNYSELAWVTDGTQCEYHDGAFQPLYDLPYSDYYINGLVTGQLAPGTYLPIITDASAGTIDIPVTVIEFDDIAMVSLVFLYDKNVITFTGHTPNSAFTGLLNIQNNTSGTSGRITFSYFGDPVSLVDLETIATLHFNYLSGTSTLTWLTDGTWCEYNDQFFNPLYDLPYEDYYFNGLISSQVAPVVKADSVSGHTGQVVTVPVRMWNFENIASMSLTMDYDPGVLEFLCATQHPDISTVFDYGVTNPGRLFLSWFGATTTFTDGMEVIYLSFLYNGGTSPLVWFDNGASCQFSDPTFNVLYDLPYESYYINGLITDGSFVWTGTTSNDWFNPANWSNEKVPDWLSDVEISSSPLPPNYPQYSGDLELGSACRSITLSGTAELSVSGSLLIGAGHWIDVPASALLKVGESWINHGRFNCGTGTVDFTGTTDGTVEEVTSTSSAISNFIISTSAATMTPLTGASAGPTGDNTHADVNIGFTFNYLGIDYTQVRINTNGWISLNLSGDDVSSARNNYLFFNTLPQTVLAPWWDDLEADGSANVLYQASGTSPNRVFTVEWNNILSYSSTASSARLNFQVKLYETSNVIEFCYGAVTGGSHSSDEGASIGIKDAIGGIGHFLEATSGSAFNLTSCLVSTTDWPTVNYTFNPPIEPELEIFYNFVGSKDNATIFIERDVKVLNNVNVNP